MPLMANKHLMFELLTEYIQETTESCFSNFYLNLD